MDTKKPKQNKYKNKKVEWNGLKFDSEKEFFRYKQLLELVDLGEIYDLEIQKTFELIPSQKYKGKTYRNCRYICDFCYKLKDGTKVVEDVKGFSCFKKGFSTETPEFKIKRKLFIQEYGEEYDFRIV